jgi:2-methylcitrate dehydratase PrpD
MMTATCSPVHIGCVAVSTCFAVAERIGGVSGKEFVTAMVLGADFDSRLALAARPGKSLITFGWHPTVLFGYLSSAAMAGRLMKLDQEKMVNALGIAYHMCAGNTQCGADGALTKRMGPGLASKGGITAALMAEKGITGAHNSLEGKSGLYNVYHGGDYDPKVLTADLGKRFEGVNIGYKPYPCCGFTHSFIDAVLSLKSKHHIRPEDVREIMIYGGASSLSLCTPERRTPHNVRRSPVLRSLGGRLTLVRGKAIPGRFTLEAITVRMSGRLAKGQRHAGAEMDVTEWAGKSGCI